MTTIISIHIIFSSHFALSQLLLPSGQVIHPDGFEELRQSRVIKAWVFSRFFRAGEGVHATFRSHRMLASVLRGGIAER